jgi:adenylate cyclase
MAGTITDEFAGDSKMPLLQNDHLTTNLLVQNILKYPGIVNAYILNERLFIEAHKELAEVGIKYYGYEDGILNAQGPSPWLIQENEAIFTFATPIIFKETKVGYVVVSFSKDFIREKVKETQKRIAFITISVIVVVIILSIPLASRLLKPIFMLVKGTNEIILGNLWYRIPHGKRDEIGDLIDSFNRMASELEKKEILKGAFNRYVSPHVANEILKNPEKIQLAGERREITVLFADIRGFTALTRQLQPEEVVELLNRYFTILTEIIFSFHGTVDKFIGDEVMGVFGSPIPNEDHLQDGLKSAIVIKIVMTEINRLREKKGLVQLPMGIGLDSGHVIVGSMGSKVRMEYTAIGDTVNVASRLTGIAKNGEILVSEKVCARVEKEVSCIRMPDVNVKGIETPFTIYNVIGIKDAWKPVIYDAVNVIKNKIRREDIAF